MPPLAARKRLRDDAGGEAAPSGAAPATATGRELASHVEKAKPVSPFNVDNVVVALNVGGCVLHTFVSTLCAESSDLSTWASENFASLPRDGSGLPFIDRDPENFRNILNYLRGYELPLTTEQLVLLAEDAQFYGIRTLCEKIGTSPPAQWRFAGGPGVSADRTEFTTGNIVGLCGTEPLAPKGLHSITIRIEKCELVAVGIIACEGAQEDKLLHYQKNSISYCSNGELVTYLGDASVSTSGLRYKEQDLITVTVTFRAVGEGSTAEGQENEALDEIGHGTRATQQPTRARVVFFHGDTSIHDIEWEAPVPPVKFAVSLFGASALSIVNSFSNDRDLLDTTEDSVGRAGTSDVAADSAERTGR